MNRWISATALVTIAAIPIQAALANSHPDKMDQHS